MNIALTHAGRILLALYFLAPGIMKFTAWDMHITLMETHGMPIQLCSLRLPGLFKLALAFVYYLTSRW